jgi:hypothetical protein
MDDLSRTVGNPWRRRSPVFELDERTAKLFANIQLGATQEVLNAAKDDLAGPDRAAVKDLTGRASGGAAGNE